MAIALIFKTLQIEAQLHMLRGQIFEALENRTKVALCYKQALLKDAFCYEVTNVFFFLSFSICALLSKPNCSLQAFEALVDKYMLTGPEGISFYFTSSLCFLTEAFSQRVPFMNSYPFLMMPCIFHPIAEGTFFKFLTL